MLVGHSTGGGEVARYVGRYGTKPVEKLFLISAVPPIVIKTEGNPEGLPLQVFDNLRASLVKDPSQSTKTLLVRSTANRTGAKVSQGLLDQFWLSCMQASLESVYKCSKAFSETDFTDDLKKFDVPALLMHGEETRSFQ